MQKANLPPIAKAGSKTTSFQNADLHCHSTASDGTLTPAALAQRAKANGVDLWALTDHDEIKAIGQARQAAKDNGLAYLTGVEVSVSFCDETVHIVGLGFDETNPQLIAGLNKVRSGRDARAQEISADLAKVGIANAYEGALQFAGNPDLISRTHFARYIVQSGHCQSTYEVFAKYLTQGKPGFVPHRWAKLIEAVTWITEAGGVAVIAHPGRYKFTANQEYALFYEFKQFGGQGVEVVTGSHASSEFNKYLDFAKEFSLKLSRGSDFHSPDESRTDLGQLPSGFDMHYTSPNNVWDLVASNIALP